jgi:hypothetical protein
MAAGSDEREDAATGMREMKRKRQQKKFANPNETAELRSMWETMHLLCLSKNAQRLMAALHPAISSVIDPRKNFGGPSL